MDNAQVEVGMLLVGQEAGIAQEDQVVDTALGDQEVDINPEEAALNLKDL